MPSGITHMIISIKAVDQMDHIKEDQLQMLIHNNRGAYIMGCVGPDLPYMTLMDVEVWKNRKEVADHLHYEKTNEVPLKGFAHAKKLFEEGKQDEADALFAFYLGYCSHVIADGIVHPFVRDMVGDYEVAATPHRVLEMKLDVLVAEHLFKKDVNQINFHDELEWRKEISSMPIIYSSFADIIKETYGHDVTAKEVSGWVDTMDFVFDFTTGNFPFWYQKLLGNKGLSHKDLSNVRAEKDSLTI